MIRILVLLTALAFISVMLTACGEDTGIPAGVEAPPDQEAPPVRPAPGPTRIDMD